MKVLYEDNHLLVVSKPAGQIVQGDKTGRRSLVDEAKNWLKQKYGKPGNVYLGLVHRIDRLSSGVVVLAKTSKAGSRLSEEFRKRGPAKVYWAQVEGKLPEEAAWVDMLKRTDYASRVVEAPDGKEARLRFRRLAYSAGVSLAEITLETGRHHQIRVQFAYRGHHILGDRRYGSMIPFAPDAIALHARSITLRHPTKGEEMTFTSEPPPEWNTVGAPPAGGQSNRRMGQSGGKARSPDKGRSKGRGKV
ncbi:MAG: RNA pseudouridine synthase [Gemmatimonadetes bacterium]|nr:RNA pseudouridine synthase [Gemmatimonadota bacterium]